MKAKMLYPDIYYPNVRHQKASILLESGAFITRRNTKQEKKKS